MPCVILICVITKKTHGIIFKLVFTVVLGEGKCHNESAGVRRQFGDVLLFYHVKTGLLFVGLGSKFWPFESPPNSND